MTKKKTPRLKKGPDICDYVVERGNGYNWLTAKGVEICRTLLLLGDE